MTYNSIFGVWKWVPHFFFFTPKCEVWNSKGITLYFSEYRKEFGLLLGGGGGKKEKKKKETQAQWKIKPPKYTVEKKRKLKCNSGTRSLIAK